MFKGKALTASHPQDEELGNRKHATSDDKGQREQRAEAEAKGGNDARAKRAKNTTN